MTDLATPFLADASALTELEDWGPLAEATGEPMSTAGVTLWTGEDGAEAGVWECTAGPSRWLLETHEFVHVLSGSMTVTPDGGEAFEAGPGSSFVVPKGWSGTWDIHDTLRKLYVIF
jgi:uncharacterized protein